MKEGMVSIILCTYNGERYLGEQLNSLEKQTYQNTEVICSDNNSTDESFDILSKWRDGHTNRKLILCTEKGLNKNFFNAIKHANGEFVIFCDQDDIWLPEKIEKLVNFQRKHEDATMVYCLSERFSGTAPEISSAHTINPLEGNDVRKTMLLSFTLGHNMLIRKKVLDNIPLPPDETVAFDWWITVSAMCIGSIKCLRETLTYWRQHDRNTTKKINADYFYSSRINYLNAFAKHPQIYAESKIWIQKAIELFETLKEKSFSLPLFWFLLANGNTVFFYKNKKNPFFKWFSFGKWALRMSKKSYRP